MDLVMEEKNGMHLEGKDTKKEIEKMGNRMRKKLFGKGEIRKKEWDRKVCERR